VCSIAEARGFTHRSASHRARETVEHEQVKTRCSRWAARASNCSNLPPRIPPSAASWPSAAGTASLAIRLGGIDALFDRLRAEAFAWPATASAPARAATVLLHSSGKHRRSAARDRRRFGEPDAPRRPVRMKILLIDTCGEIGSVALADTDAGAAALTAATLAAALHPNGCFLPFRNSSRRAVAAAVAGAVAVIHVRVIHRRARWTERGKGIVRGPEPAPDCDFPSCRTRGSGRVSAFHARQRTARCRRAILFGDYSTESACAKQC